MPAQSMRYIAVGILAVAVTFFFAEAFDEDVSVATAESPPPMDERLTELESVIKEIRASIDSLQSQISTLSHGTETSSEGTAQREIDTLLPDRSPGVDAFVPESRRQPPPNLSTLARTIDDPKRFAEQMQGALKQYQQERLLLEGFTSDKVASLTERADELRLEAIEQQYKASADPERPRALVSQIEYVLARLREELGEQDYEKYRRASGLTTNVIVAEVLKGSTAETAGLRPGDVITHYDGRRIYDMGELDSSSRNAPAGSWGTLEVQRDGNVIQLLVPREALGIVESPNLGIVPPLRR